MNGFQNIVGAQQRIIIPESQYAESERFKCGGSPLVVLLLIQMLAAIELDNQAMLDTRKIGNEPIHWMLTTKLDSQLLRAKL